MPGHGAVVAVLPGLHDLVSFLFNGIPPGVINSPPQRPPSAMVELPPVPRVHTTRAGAAPTVGIAAAIRSQSTTMYGLPPRERWSWFWLVQAAGVVELVLLLVIGGLLRDREALAFAVVVAISLVWVRF